MESLFTEIESLPLFKNIDRKELALHISKLQYYKKRYEKNTPLILQGMPYKALYILLGGTCIGEMADVTGRVIKIEDFHSPYVIASALLFAGDNRMPVSVRTKTDVEVLIIKRSDVIKLCKMQEQFLINLLSDVADKFTFISRKLTFLNFKTLEERILLFLSNQVPDKDGFIHVKQKIAELSSLFGVERPSLSRALSRMEGKGIIVREGKRVKVLDVNLHLS